MTALRSINDNREFSKPINSKTNEPILINFFLKETRIFSLQVCEEFLLKFHMENVLQRFKNLLKLSLCYEIFSQIVFDKNSSQICREKILFSFKKKFIKLGLVVF